MSCPRCQAHNPQGARFCEECGARLEVLCPSCGVAVTPGKKFCRSCGASVSGPTAAKSPESYVPKHLAEKILTSRAALEGERKHVTVLFADLKGSMELLAYRDAEDARRILDSILSLMLDAVHRYEGTVNQVMGDGIMALFGAPIAHEDHAVRACYAALAMQTAVKKFAEEFRRPQTATPEIRVGINSGEVIVRAIRSDLHMDYTAVGETTHLAARMEQMAAPGTILITEATCALAKGHVQAIAHGPRVVKGLADPISIYELNAADSRRPRFTAATTAKFVGRDSELAQLHRAMERAASGHGQVLAVVGEPGVGKSRLFHELLHDRRNENWLVLHSSAVSYEATTPYLPLIELLKEYFQIQDSDESPKIAEKVAGRLVALDEQLWASRSAFLFLFDAPSEDPGWEGLEPLQRRKQLQEACRKLVLCESRIQPVLLAIENLHWIDSETQTFLDALVEGIRAASVLLLVNYRTEYRHDWTRKSYYQQLYLDILSVDNAAELLNSLLGSDATLGPMKRLLAERTQGNPFFVEECVRALWETGILMGDPGEYRAVREPGAIEVPQTVRAILAARIDRLDPEDKYVLQAASVIGKNVPIALLEAMTELRSYDLQGAVVRLQRAEFLYESRLFPELEYAFKHALTRDVAYGTLLSAQRRDLHSAVMSVLEQRPGERSAEEIDALVRHAVGSQRWAEAVMYSQRAATSARMRSAHRQAIGYAEQALAALEHLPESAERQRTAIELYLDLRGSLYLIGEFNGSMSVLRKAEALAERLSDLEPLSWITMYIGENHRIQGNTAEALSCLERARVLSERTNASAVRTGATHFLGMTRYVVGDYREAVGLLREVAEDPKAFDTRRKPTSGSRTAALSVNAGWLARSLAILGDFDEAISHGEEAIRLADSVGTPYSMALAALSLGEVYRERGDFVRAVPLLERAAALTHEWELGVVHSVTTSRLGAAYAVSGQLSQAMDLLSQAARSVQHQNRSTRYSVIFRLLGEGYVLAGNLAEAQRCGARALEGAEALAQRGDKAAALWLLGRSAADSEAGTNAFHQALVLAREAGMRPLLAHCYFGLSQVFGRTAKSQEQHEHLRAATTMYRDMQMRFWLEKAEAELKDPA